MRFWIVTLGSVFLGAVGIGLEIAAAISKDNGGVSPSLFDSWPCADPIYFARLPRPPEKCIFLRVGSVLNCERLTPAIRASLMIRTIPSRSFPLCSLFRLRSWSKVSTGLFECGMYAKSYVSERLVSYDL